MSDLKNWQEDMTNKIGINWKALVKETLLRRKAKGLTQKAHADLLCISVPTLSKFECGETNMSLDIVFKILDSVGLVEKTNPKRLSDLELFVEAGHDLYTKLPTTNNGFFLMACQINEPYVERPNFLSQVGEKPFSFQNLISQDFIRRNAFEYDENPLFPQLNYFGLTQKEEFPLICVANRYFEDINPKFKVGSSLDALQPLINIRNFVHHCMDIAKTYTDQYNVRYTFSITFNGLYHRIMKNQNLPLSERDCSGLSTKNSVTLTLDCFPYQTNDDTIFNFALPLYQAFGFKEIPEIVKKSYEDFVLRNVPEWMRHFVKDDKESE